MPDDDPIITMADCASIGFCASGVRRFIRANGLDMRKMIDHGYRVSEVAHIESAHLQRAIAVAVRRSEREPNV